MAEDLMRYDRLAQDALRGVVRAALTRAAGPGGLPGQHHFYITFKTRSPGVVLPAELLAKYPDEMTIVLKSRFWELEVEDEAFSVVLTFSEVPARLTIPFAGITRFFDPTVEFGLQFQVELPEPFVVPEAVESEDGEADEESAGGEVVRLDTFRKK